MRYPNKHKFVPKIYAYTTKEHKKDSLIKVGYTERQTIEKRISQQFPILGPYKGKDYLILKDEGWDAIRNDGTYFKDYEVHKVLKDKNLGMNGEWFKCSFEELENAILQVKTGTKISNGCHKDFNMRPEQEDAVKKTSDFFRKSTDNTKFLWNAKMRFGKTFTSYKLALEMNWNKILVLTYKPAVKNAWKDDLNSHCDFQGWSFIDALNEKNAIMPQNRSVVFTSFQDILSDKTGIKEKFKEFKNIEWDAIIIDEYHYGAWQDTAKEIYVEDNLDVIDGKTVLKSLKTKYTLFLSGTPFRALNEGEFTEDQIFSWTYLDEQKAKNNWIEDHNPYFDLPQLCLLTYQLPDDVREVAMTTNMNEFDLNEFFFAEDKGANSDFKYKDAVQKWLEFLIGFKDAKKCNEDKNCPKPFSDTRLKEYLMHSFWFLPSVAACHAMKNLLSSKDNKKNYGDYSVIVAAGTSAGSGANALIPVKDAITENPEKTKTITLSCGKLTTGVTVEEWTAIFILRNLESPETYFQSAFRVQSPWVKKDNQTGKIECLKDICYVFDFSPQRALRQIANYCKKLCINSENKFEETIQEFINFLPILAFDNGIMQDVDVKELLDISVLGTGSSMLARRFQSAQLVSLNNDVLQSLTESDKIALGKIIAERNIHKLDQIIISSEDSLQDKSTPEKTNSSGLSKEQDKTLKKEMVDWQKKLIKLITKLPLFMYLTDFREESLKSVINGVEGKLFETVTGITVQEFNGLFERKVFNEKRLNEAILAFRVFEESSLNFMDINEQKKTPNCFGVFYDIK